MSAVVDVLIVTYNNSDTIGGTLQSLVGCELVRSTVVVDNCSPDKSAQAAREAGADVVVENDRNAGFAAGVNAALEHAQAPYVLLLNPDARLSCESLTVLVRALEDDPTSVMAGPMLAGDDGTLNAGARRFTSVLGAVIPHVPLVRKALGSERFTTEYGRVPEAGVVSVDYLWGAALLIRREFLYAAGGLDERYFMYSEDEDLGRTARSQDAGVLLVTDAVAIHVGAVSSAGRRDLIMARQVRARAQLLEKWEGASASKRYVAAMRAALRTQLFVASLRGRREDQRMAARSLQHLRNPQELGG